MPLRYKLHQINRKFSDGRRDSANGKWYARACVDTVRTTEQLAKDISYATTVTEADVLAVLKSLVKVFGDAFGNSQGVRLDGIGVFKPAIKSRGALEPEGFSVSKHIKGCYLNFQPEYTVDIWNRKRNTPLLAGIKFMETTKNAVGVETE